MTVFCVVQAWIDIKLIEMCNSHAGSKDPLMLQVVSDKLLDPCN